MFLYEVTVPEKKRVLIRCPLHFILCAIMYSAISSLCMNNAAHYFLFSIFYYTYVVN